MRKIRFGAVLITAVLGVFLLWQGFVWTVNRVYVREGNSLMLRYKGPLIFQYGRKSAKAGFFAQDGEVGILGNLKGPGRHFYCPVWYERTVVPDLVVNSNEVAIITSKMGGPLPTGEFLVDGDLGETKHKGILRKALGPGRYRIHPYAYDHKIVKTQTRSVGTQVKHAGWVQIPTGYVGVVTYLADNEALGKKAGIQNEVLPPGLYPVNPYEREIDIIEIGYRETSMLVTQKTKEGKVLYDESGEPEPVPETGINFPSNDGFEIQMDFTGIWGVMPENAGEIVKKFGNIEAVEQKVIIPQSESICRNNGSKLGAVELLIGESRQVFQDDVSKEFELVLNGKGLDLLYGLVRHIYIPQSVRLPIQEGYIADENKLTRDQEQLTAQTEAMLEEAKQTVFLETAKIVEDTKKQVAKVQAEGEKEAKEIDADTKALVAAIDKQAAIIQAQKTVVLGEATAAAEKMSQEAKAEKFGLAVKAFGDGAAYTQWQFAEGLPDNINLKMIFAGDGTLWTDLDNITPTLPVAQPKGAKE
jgi:regulator of protease activity HflC (stomatin/prohibitin superfamily)